MSLFFVVFCIGKNDPFFPLLILLFLLFSVVTPRLFFPPVWSGLLFLGVLLGELAFCVVGS